MNPSLRKYKSSDLNALVSLLHDDDLGRTREENQSLSESNYQQALRLIAGSEYFDVYVLELAGEIIGCFQIMFLPHISFKGSTRCQVESVRVKSDWRGRGFGRLMMEHAIDMAKKRDCKIFQLTSNKSRSKQAHKFYESLGMQASHEGYKLYL